MNKVSLTWIANLSLVLIGVVGNVMGPVMPEVIREYGLSLTTAGMVFTAQGLGRIVAVFSTSSWSDRVGRKPVLRLGGILMMIGAIGYGLSPAWVGHILSAIIIGAGSGMLDGASNALVSDLHTEGSCLKSVACLLWLRLPAGSSSGCSFPGSDAILEVALCSCGRDGRSPCYLCLQPSLS